MSVNESRNYSSGSWVQKPRVYEIKITKLQTNCCYFAITYALSNGEGSALQTLHESRQKSGIVSDLFGGGKWGCVMSEIIDENTFLKFSLWASDKTLYGRAEKIATSYNSRQACHHIAALEH